MEITSDEKGFFNPDNKVIGVLDNRQAVEQAYQDLTAAGAEDEIIHVLRGHDGKEEIDIEGENHGPLGKIIRSVQKVADGEGQTFKEYYRELNAGRFLISVAASDREKAAAIGIILKRYGGHRTYYYTPLTVETIIE
jgi:hypothetical protein